MGKIVQLVPAPPGWWVLIGVPGDAIKWPVPFFALIESSEGQWVVPVVQDGKYLVPASANPMFFELWDPIHARIMDDAYARMAVERKKEESDTRPSN
jgi:hypothetical protein